MIWSGFFQILIDENWENIQVPDYYTILRICLDFGFQSTTLINRRTLLQNRKISKFIFLPNATSLKDCFRKTRFGLT